MYQKRKPTCTKICFTLPQGWWSCCMSSSDAGSFFLFFSLAWTHVFLLSDCHGLTADVIARVKQIINFPTCIQHSYFSCLHPRPTLLSPITVSCAPADSPAVFRFIFVMKHSRRWRLNIYSFQELHVSGITRFRNYSFQELLVLGITRFRNYSFQELLVLGITCFRNYSFQEIPQIKSRKLLQRRLSPRKILKWEKTWNE